MMRAFFFAAGLFVALWGGTCLLVDKVVLKPDIAQERPTGMRAMTGALPFADSRREIDPPEWAAFSLLSIGSVTMLYAVALPKKKEG